MKSHFEGYVSDIFKSRQEAKKRGNEVLSYIYKILLNSLYGRFGIQPESTMTTICEENKYNYLIKNKDFIIANKLSDKYYILSYLNKRDDATDWAPPRLSVVQLAAAITSCLRIHMYKSIYSEDGYYTDTDFVVLKNPLPEKEISSKLGKSKLEYNVKKGTFLAPKSDLLELPNDDIIKHKGLTKKLV